MLIIFLLKDNAVVLFHLKSLKVQLVFHGLSYVSKHKLDIFFSFIAYKILRAMFTFFLNFFQSSISDGKFITF